MDLWTVCWLFGCFILWRGQFRVVVVTPHTWECWESLWFTVQERRFPPIGLRILATHSPLLVLVRTVIERDNTLREPPISTEQNISSAFGGLFCFMRVLSIGENRSTELRGVTWSEWITMNIGTTLFQIMRCVMRTTNEKPFTVMWMEESTRYSYKVNYVCEKKSIMWLFRPKEGLLHQLIKTGNYIPFLNRNDVNMIKHPKITGVWQLGWMEAETAATSHIQLGISQFYSLSSIHCFFVHTEPKSPDDPFQ